MPDSPVRGDRAPVFHLPSTSGDVSLEELLAAGKRLVLAFYFEDATPSCESEISMLRDAWDIFVDQGTNVLAVSADDVESHREFAQRLGGLPFPLAADPSLEVARAYGVIDDGDPRRARRAVFVIDSDISIMLALPHFQPNNLSQVEAIFRALGVNV